MVPPDSDRVSPAPPYSGYHYFRNLTNTGLSPSTMQLSNCLLVQFLQRMWSYYPVAPVSTTVWANPRSLAATWGITVVFSSCGYLDVSVLRVCFLSDIPINRDGLPHSDIFGSLVACTYPKLFAACHVLHRLQMPRHPPYTLTYFLPYFVLDSIDSYFIKISSRSFSSLLRIPFQHVNELISSLSVWLGAECYCQPS